MGSRHEGLPSPPLPRRWRPLQAWGLARWTLHRRPRAPRPPLPEPRHPSPCLALANHPPPRPSPWLPRQLASLPPHAQTPARGWPIHAHHPAPCPPAWAPAETALPPKAPAVIEYNAEIVQSKSIDRSPDSCRKCPPSPAHDVPANWISPSTLRGGLVARGLAPSKRPDLPDQLMGRCKTNKSSQGRADAQRLVATRLLDRLHDPLGHFSRLQRIYPRAR